MIATMSGDVRRSYGLFLGLAGDERVRPLPARPPAVPRPHRSAGHGHRPQGAQHRTQGAPGPRGRRPGRRRSAGTRRTACTTSACPTWPSGPLYYSLYDAACVTIAAEFPDAGKGLKQTNTTPLTPIEVEEMVQLLMEADPQTVWNLITTHLRNGKSLREPRRHDPDRRGRADPADHGAAPVHRRPARRSTTATWPTTGCARSDNPYQPRVLYLMANFVNDVARSNKLYTSVLERECAGVDVDGRVARDAAARAGRGHPGVRRRRAPRRWPTRISTPARIAPPTSRRSRSPRASSRTIRTTRRSRTRRSRSTATTRRTCAIGCSSRPPGCSPGWPKMPGERDCYARFMKEWINN